MFLQSVQYFFSHVRGNFFPDEKSPNTHRVVILDQNFAQIANMRSVVKNFIYFWSNSESNIVKKNKMANNQRVATLKHYLYLAIFNLTFKSKISGIRFEGAHSKRNARIENSAKFQSLKRSGLRDISDFLNTTYFSMTLIF